MVSEVIESSKEDEESFRNLRINFRDEHGDDFELEDLRIKRNRV